MKKTKILIALFTGSLILPNLIFGAFYNCFDTENNENRTLTEFPKVTWETLEEFPKEFEAFYKDHLPFKNYFVNLNNFIDTELFQSTRIGDVTIGENNWLFYLPSKEGENAMADYQKTNLYTDGECRQISGKIEKVRDWLSEHGVEKFHYYVAPNKESIYSEYMPDKPEVVGTGDSRIEAFSRYMEENSDVEFDYLGGYLQPYKEEYQLFRKYDTHMNNLGGYITAEKLTLDLTGSCLPIEEIDIEKGTKTLRGGLFRM